MGTTATTVAPTVAAKAATAKAAPKQRAKLPADGAQATALADAGMVLQGGSQPIEPTLRTELGRRFGYDFGAVRLHADTRAARSAAALGAQAYSVGRHIVFGAGQLRPDTADGLRLLAHELAHVVQSGSAAYRHDAELALSPRDADSETEAHAVADLVAADRPVAVRASTGADDVQRLHRAEHGTYVSTLSNTGDRAYLDAGQRYYETWGHKNVKRVATMSAMLDDLDTAKGTIDSFRIVSHGSSSGLEIGLLPEIGNDYFNADPVGGQAAYTTESRFRKDFTDMEILAASKFKEIYDALWKDTTTNALLVKIGGTASLPAVQSNLGIMMRAMAEARFIADVELDTGGKPNFGNAAILNSFISQRRSRYAKALVAALPTAQQPDATKAIAALAKALPTVMAAEGIVFGTITATEAKDFADAFMEDPAKPGSGMKKSLSKSIEEGSDGPFLRKLKSVRSKVSTSTHIEIRGCNVGSQATTLDGIRGFFGSPGALPSISAPDLYQFFFQLNVQSYSAGQSADLDAAYDDMHLGIKDGFTDITRSRAGETIRLNTGGKIGDVATRYGFVADKVRKLNPEIAKPDELHSGDVLWLVQRETVPAGFYKTLDEFCVGYLGDAKATAAVQKANPAIKDPTKLDPGMQITVPKALLKSPFAAAATDKAAFIVAVRGGEAVEGLADQITTKQAGPGGRVVSTTSTFTHPHPVLHIDDSKRADAIGKWLAAQKFDPAGRTAQVLSQRFGKNGAEFERGRAGTYVQFLTRGYPNAEDPVFPEDPRYDKHIIRRP